MSFVQVKVCGITRDQGALLAAHLGADMIGMIFYANSKRCIDLGTARRIVAVLPPTVDRVGVFVDEAPAKMMKIAEQLCLDWLQLHGRETNSTIKQLQRAGFRVIKAYSVNEMTDWARIADSPADLRMLDNGTGGTGTAFDWSRIPKKGIKDIILAGGIDSRNVVEALRRVRPLVIDVNSGVESSPGVKSPVKLKQLFKMVNRERAK